MKTKLRKTLLISALLTVGISGSVQAQTLKLLAGNTLNGAMNGVILGGATMALRNSSDLDPARIGVGLGTLYGVGIGVYDITRTGKGEQFYTSGFFNDGTNTSVIVLLDTFYGAAAGVVVGTAFTLIANESVVDGLQYGSAIGSWSGFGFGLFDAFVLANDPVADTTTGYAVPPPGRDVNGLVTFTDKREHTKIGLLSPSLFTQKHLDQEDMNISYTPSLEVVNIRIKF